MVRAMPVTCPTDAVRAIYASVSNTFGVRSRFSYQSSTFLSFLFVPLAELFPLFMTRVETLPEPRARLPLLPSASLWRGVQPALGAPDTAEKS